MRKLSLVVLAVYFLLLVVVLVLSATAQAHDPISPYQNIRPLASTWRPVQTVIAVPVDANSKAPVSVLKINQMTHIVQGPKIRTCITLANGTVHCP